MTAVWTTPKTWNTGDPLTASDMNTHLRDNLEFVKSPPTGYYKANEASDYTTTSTTFVNVDATNLALTITTAGGDVLVGFSGSIKHGTSGVTSFFDVEVDGTRAAGDDGMINVTASGVNYGLNVSFVRLIRGLSAGSHTFRLQWKTASGTATLWAGAGTANGDLHPEFWVREVS